MSYKNIADNIKIDLVSMDKEKRDEILNQEASIDAIPDLDKLTGYVLEILEFLERQDIKKLSSANMGAVKMMLNNKYADKLPMGIITLLLEEENREENIDRLIRLFEYLRNAKAGSISLEDAERRLTDDVNERYLYSKYGSKEAFENALSEEASKEKRKQTNVNMKDVGKAKIK